MWLGTMMSTMQVPGVGAFVHAYQVMMSGCMEALSHLREAGRHRRLANTLLSSLYNTQLQVLLCFSAWAAVQLTDNEHS